MHAQEFNVNLARITGFDETQVRTVDRALADAGLRQKASGRNLPDITLVEGVTLLLALCGAMKLTSSDQLATTYRSFAANSPFSLTGVSVNRMEEDQLPDDFMKKHFGFDKAALFGPERLNLIGAVSILCRHLAHEYNGEAYVGVEVQIGSFVSIQCDTGRMQMQIHFSGVMDAAGIPGVETLRRIRPEVLAWIGRNAKG